MSIAMSFTVRISRLREAAAGARRGALSPAETASALVDAVALLDLLDLQAFPMSGDDTLEQVVTSVHGIDVSVRGRPHDLFVHIEDKRDDEDRTAQPLAIEIDHGGELDFGDHAAPNPERRNRR